MNKYGVKAALELRKKRAAKRAQPPAEPPAPAPSVTGSRSHPDLDDEEVSA